MIKYLPEFAPYLDHRVMPYSHSWGAPSPGELYPSRVDSLRSPKEASSLAASPYSHSQAFTCPTADPERVVLLRGFYWRSSAADVRQICEQDFGPVYVQPLFAISTTSLFRLFTNHTIPTEEWFYSIKESSTPKRLWILFTAEMQPNASFDGLSERRFIEQKINSEMDQASLTGLSECPHIHTSPH